MAGPAGSGAAGSGAASARRHEYDIDGHRVRLTHPDKVVYPSTGTTKAEVVAYYLAVADRLMPHVAGRPVTRKRWVDGVGTAQEPGDVFFEKNLPKGTPAWVDRVSIAHRSHSNDYPLVDSPATLAWFGQVGALELHVPQWRVASDGTPAPPDRLVLDLDPGPGTGLSECLGVGRLARTLLLDAGLELWPVTSGSKGLHLYAALDGTKDSAYVSAFAKQIATALAEELPDLVVTSMKKSLRDGKVLVDWSQNNSAKTTIAPYSLRGRSEPFVAAPRTWEELEEDPRQLRFEDVVDRDDDPLSSLLGTGAAAPAADRLAKYRSMRREGRTPEPVAPDDTRIVPRDDTRIFVIQEHHARRRHWDVRLEHEGVLVSWAVPKGPPTDPAANRLAVPTEDHPLEYASFAGVIPRGQYGAGEVTIWDEGPCDVEKWRADEVIATLHGRPGGGLGGSVTFAFIRTGDNWLMHRMTPAAEPDNTPESDEPDESQTPVRCEQLPTPAPMLAERPTRHDAVPGGDEGWLFDLKWDGVRIIAACDDDDIRLRGRSGNDATASYPEIVEALQTLGLKGTVLDGEVVALDDAGVPSFARIQQRIGLTREADVGPARRAVPVRYHVFDLLRLDGTDTSGLTVEQRKLLLAQLALDEADGIRVPEPHEGGLDAALEASRKAGFEGVIAKRRGSRYRWGVRSHDWIKFKHETTAEVVVIGWRPGQGNRSGSIGSLLVAVRDPATNDLVYAGRVGTGFDERELAALMKELTPLRAGSTSFDVPPDVARDANWVDPVLVGEVSFAGRTDGGFLRHAVWRGWRPDKAADDLQPPDDV